MLALIQEELSKRGTEDQALDLLDKLRDGYVLEDLKLYVDNILAIHNPNLLTGITTRLIIDHETGETVKEVTDSIKVAQANQDSLNNSFDEALNYSNYSINPPERLKTYIERMPIQAILKTDGTDETTKLKAYIAQAKLLNRPLKLPKGIITFSDTLLIDFTVDLSGYGRDQTILQFKNNVANKPAIKLVRGSTKSWFQSFTLRDQYFNTSTGVLMTDSRTDVGTPCWKNGFVNIEISGFNTGLTITSANPLDGSTHAHCDGNYFAQCRFVMCKLAVLIQNCQAVHNVFVAFNVNNTDNTMWMDGQIKNDDNFKMIRDEAGGGITILGADLVGKGMLYEWYYPSNASGLFAGSGSFEGQDLRFELRPTHNGVIIQEALHGTLNLSMANTIRVRNLKTVNYGATIDLFKFAGMCKATFENTGTVQGTGKLLIRNYPTLGRSSNASVGVQANVVLNNCENVEYIKEVTSPFGTYSRAATPSIVFNDTATSSTNANYTLDAQGFRVLQHGGDIQQFGYGFNSAGNFGKIVFNIDDPNSGVLSGGDVKFRLPKYGRPLKLFFYKMGVRFTVETSVDLYLVKDTAQWANSTFNLASDAILVSSSSTTANKAGYFEYPVVLTSNIVGAAFQSGFDSWLEGRMMFVVKGGNTFSGFIGVEYV
ncbi:hypothetical protein ABFO74_18310 [Acinetobacter baumannii]